MKVTLRLSLVLGVWITGSLLAFYPILFSGFASMQAGPIDSRFLHYVLEHGYLWLCGDPLHASFWSPPYFYPAENTAAYGDVLLSLAPLYWVWRFLGFLPDTSYQLWLISLASLNFFTALFVLRRAFRLAWPSAVLGAEVFAYGAPRLAQLPHPQLLGGFYTLLLLYALLRLLRSVSAEERRRRSLWLLLAAGAAQAQLWASFYLGWFLALGIATGLAAALAVRSSRCRVLEILREQKAFLAVGVAGSVLVAWPLASHYLAAAKDVGTRSIAEIEPMLPRAHSWFYLGPQSWLYDWMAAFEPFASLPMEHEHRLGAGLFTLALAAAGLWRYRHVRAVRFAAGVALALCIGATLLPGGWTAWTALRTCVPGASAIRAVCRIALLTLVPLSLGIALFVESRPPARRGVWALLVLAGCLAEQAAARHHYDKHAIRRDVAALAARIAPDTEAFLYTPQGGRWLPFKYHVDAMWAATESGVPTINGYSGNHPPRWHFEDIVIRRKEDGMRLGHALLEWSALRGLDARGIQWVQHPETVRSPETE